MLVRVALNAPCAKWAFFPQTDPPPTLANIELGGEGGHANLALRFAGWAIISQTPESHGRLFRRCVKGELQDLGARAGKFARPGGSGEGGIYARPGWAQAAGIFSHCHLLNCSSFI